jgi:hypothetical protein
MRAIPSPVLGLATLLLVPVLGLAQGPGGGRPGGRDPEQMFNMLSGGKDVIVRSEISDPQMQLRFDRMADRLGITDGRITRDQFTGMMQQRGGGSGNAPGGGQGAGGGGLNNADAMANYADRWFSSLDTNGDGVLNSDEMPESLRIERDKWDSDHNGLIDLMEFRAYFQARFAQRLADQNAAGGAPWPGGSNAPEAEPAPLEDPKPTVYRYGNLPKEVPAWFGQLDTDKDAQIGLYEWKVSGRPIEEFIKMDRNGDGFLTVDEVLYAQREGKSGSGNSLAADGSTPNGNFNGSFQAGQGRNGFNPGGGGAGNRRGNGGGRSPRGPRNSG